MNTMNNFEYFNIIFFTIFCFIGSCFCCVLLSDFSDVIYIQLTIVFDRISLCFFIKCMCVAVGNIPILWYMDTLSSAWVQVCTEKLLTRVNVPYPTALEKQFMRFSPFCMQILHTIYISIMQYEYGVNCNHHVKF